MKYILLIINILFLPFTASSQWNTEEPYKDILVQVNKFYLEHNISDTISDFNYSFRIQLAQNYIDHNLNEINTIISFIKKSQEDTTSIRNYKKAVNNLFKITKQPLHKYYENNKKEYLYLYKSPFFNKLNKNDKYYIYYILGQCNLNSSIKKRLLKEIDLPVIVRAKLNDEHALKSIFNNFLEEYLDTISYDEPKEKHLTDLLYLNSKQALYILNEVLSSNHVIYKEVENTFLQSKIKPWDVISINKYIYSELSEIYPYESGFIKFITYDYLADKNKDLGTLLFGIILEDYLTEKFDFKFSVSFKKNKLIDESVYIPPPSFRNNEKYIKKYIYGVFGFEGELFNYTYGELRKQVLNNWESYYKRD